MLLLALLKELKGIGWNDARAAIWDWNSASAHFHGQKTGLQPDPLLPKDLAEILDPVLVQVNLTV